MELRIPKIRAGSYFPSLPEQRWRGEKALLSVVQPDYVVGVSTRRVDDLIKSLGCDGMSRSRVSRICRDLDRVVETFPGRPLDGGPCLHVRLDALPRKAGEGGRIVNVSVVVATTSRAAARYFRSDRKPTGCRLSSVGTPRSASRRPGPQQAQYRRSSRSYYGKFAGVSATVVGLVAGDGGVDGVGAGTGEAASSAPRDRASAQAPGTISSRTLLLPHPGCLRPPWRTSALPLPYRGW